MKLVRLLASIAISLPLSGQLGAVVLDHSLGFTLIDQPDPISGERDGIVDRVRDGQFIGQVTGPSSAANIFHEESFLEFHIAALDQPQAKSILHLNFFYSDVTGGTGKTVSASVYRGTGTASLSPWGGGTLVTNIVLPSIPNPGGAFALRLEITSELNQLIMNSANWLGIRLHDAQYRLGTPIDINANAAQVSLGSGNGLYRQYIVTSAVNISEPITLVLFALGICGLGAVKRRTAQSHRDSTRGY